MKKISLVVQKRTVTGNKVKSLRKQGIIPANIFGKAIKSQSLQTEEKAFTNVYRQSGETGIVELQIEGDKGSRPVLITKVQTHPVTGAVLHVDFRQVDLREKVTATIPLVVSGNAPAVVQKIGALLTPLNEVEVQALPMDLPEEIQVDVSGLSELDVEAPAEAEKATPQETPLAAEPKATKPEAKEEKK
ncbi:50S ribosomal protein L25 [Candidatus Gottesmanbacteria bacterium]|nr:50S ribosomal protein L25 [Candidatus Gottesmanbacteria bacterium]